MKTLNRWLRTLLLGCAIAIAGAAHAEDVPKQLTNYVGCIKDPVPVTNELAPSYRLVDAPRVGFADVLVWRYVCLDNPNKSMILIRITPYPIGDALITGANVTALQNGVTVGPFNLLQTTRDVAGYIGYLDRETTFILAQSSVLTVLLDENAAFKMVFSQGHETATLDIPARGYEDVVRATAVEYFNTTIKHYFITANPAEIALLDAGGAGGGWVRTGQTFTIFYNSVFNDTLPVCRFYAPKPGPNTHFYTVDHNECVQVNKDPSWKFEGIAFYATQAHSDIPFFCENIDMRPVYRFYNGRAAQNDSNHRYVADTALISPTIAQGYTNEGVVMCVPLH